MIFDNLPFVETLSRLVSTCFQRYIKDGVPGRPVVNFSLQLYLPTIPTFIKDTDDLIRRVRSIIHLPSDVLLVTFDEISLCPSIPHDFDLRALNDFLSDRNLPS